VAAVHIHTRIVGLNARSLGKTTASLMLRSTVVRMFTTVLDLVSVTPHSVAWNRRVVANRTCRSFMLVSLKVIEMARKLPPKTEN
jgi:hypothetical protein